MGKVPRYPVAMCPRCKRRMVPKGRKPVLLTDRLVEVAYSVRAAARKPNARSERSEGRLG